MRRELRRISRRNKLYRTLPSITSSHLGCLSTPLCQYLHIAPFVASRGFPRINEGGTEKLSLRTKSPNVTAALSLAVNSFISSLLMNSITPALDPIYNRAGNIQRVSPCIPLLHMTRIVRPSTRAFGFISLSQDLPRFQICLSCGEARLSALSQRCDSMEI